MEFVNLKRQYKAYKEEIDSAISNVLENTAFINGPDVSELEKDLADFLGKGRAVICASGTDALFLPLMAKGIKEGDEVLVPSFTFIATASMVKLSGATPVFVDVDSETFNMDVSDAQKKINKNTKGIIPVSLYGQCADMDAINALAKEHGLWVMEDAAQSFGAEYKGRKSCTLTDMATTSFFPAKPLGGYGDGGAIFTSDEDLADKLISIRNHGQAGRYNHTSLGINGRMDTLQAAIVRVKLKHFPEEIRKRNEIAKRYSEKFKNLPAVISVPKVQENNLSTWAQYTLRIKNRDEFRNWLSKKDIPSAVHYPIPLNRQPVFASLNSPACRVSEELADQVVSLPIHPFLTEEEISKIIEAVCEFSV